MYQGNLVTIYHPRRGATMPRSEHKEVRPHGYRPHGGPISGASDAAADHSESNDSSQHAPKASGSPYKPLEAA